ncbi:hypothetical protein ACIQI8_36700 [Streptomyces sp. NPDC092369]|uniref:hypothetical protein n=1 Tax=Streptomyces sp. NPDC092369 TaxID=3366015 RepID=UPI00381DB88D
MSGPAASAAASAATAEAAAAAASAVDPATDDLALAVRLLAATPTHENRTPAELRRWALAADAFGAALDPGPPCRTRIVERGDGLGQLLLARYTSRPATVELYTDTIDRAETLIDELGWRAWYPVGSVRAAALAHESAHALLHRKGTRSALKEALGHTALRLGRHRVLAHVAGADELVAHAYARTVCGLGRSPLLLTAALAAAVATPGRQR